MNKDEKTFVILIPGFPENEADTTCLPMQQSFARSLKETYPLLNIIILSFQYPYFKKKYNWFGMTVISFNGQNKGGLSRLLLRRKIYAALKEINKTNKISGLLSFWHGECAWVGKRFAAKHSLQHYCWLMGQDAKKENNYPERMRSNGGELIALSDFLQDEFEKNHRIRPQYVIPPGIYHQRPNNGKAEKDIDILAAGSLIPLKQYNIFLHIVSEIKKQLPQVKVILIGDGPEKSKLQTLITAYGLQSNITLAGELPYPEVLNTMQRARVFLHPSSYEGFSGVCLEALWAGAHVISFCRAMKQEIKQWYIVSSREEMQQKALDTLQNPNLVFEKLTTFKMENTVKKIMELYND